MKKNKRVIAKISVIIGVCLLVIGASVLGVWQYSIHSSAQKSQEYVKTLRDLMPDVQGAVLQERKDNDMPVLCVDDIDFIGIIEMPKFGSSLPVCAQWEEVSKHPSVFSGSIYDRTIKIGATSQKGQYDFYREVSVGDPVFFTDMEGNRFAYEITDIRHENHADQTTLQQEDAALTLFIKNIYSFEYIIIFCDPCG